MSYDYFTGQRKSRKEKKLKRRYRVYKRGGKFRTVDLNKE